MFFRGFGSVVDADLELATGEFEGDGSEVDVVTVGESSGGDPDAVDERAVS